MRALPTPHWMAITQRLKQSVFIAWKVMASIVLKKRQLQRDEPVRKAYWEEGTGVALKLQLCFTLMRHAVVTASYF